MYQASAFFRFNEDKVIEAILYLINNHKHENISCIRAAILLYFADKTHLERYGRTITEDSYIAVTSGIVPEGTYYILNKVYAGKTDLGFHCKGSSLVADRVPDYNEMSESDISILAETLEVFGKLPFWHIMQIARDGVWRKSSNKIGDTSPVDILDIINSVDDEDRRLLQHLMRDSEDPPPLLDPTIY